MLTICGASGEGTSISPAVKYYRFLLRPLAHDIAASPNHHHNRMLDCILRVAGNAQRVPLDTGNIRVWRSNIKTDATSSENYNLRFTGGLGFELVQVSTLKA